MRKIDSNEEQSFYEESLEWIAKINEWRKKLNFFTIKNRNRGQSRMIDRHTDTQLDDGVTPETSEAVLRYLDSKTGLQNYKDLVKFFQKRENEIHNFENALNELRRRIFRKLGKLELLLKAENSALVELGHFQSKLQARQSIAVNKTKVLNEKITILRDELEKRQEYLVKFVPWVQRLYTDTSELSDPYKDENIQLLKHADNFVAIPNTLRLLESRITFIHTFFDYLNVKADALQIDLEDVNGKSLALHAREMENLHHKIEHTEIDLKPPDVFIRSDVQVLLNGAESEQKFDDDEFSDDEE